MRNVSRLLFSCILLGSISAYSQHGARFVINDSNYFEKRGLNVLLFTNYYGLFGDEKLSGMEIIHHGVRTATNGDARLGPTPEQWDSTPKFIRRDIKKANHSIEAFLRYPSYDFNYSIKV